MPDLSPLKDALVSSITPSQLVAILASIVGVGMTFVLMWFAVRKLKSIFTNSVFFGKLSFKHDYKKYSKSSFSNNSDREIYKQLLGYEHKKGVRHYNDDDFI